MRIKFGMASTADGPAEGVPVFWDSERVMNSHFVLVGPSGSGKTTRLRRLMAGVSVLDPTIRWIVLDPHGDMKVDGESDFRFSENSELGLNPLRVREDPDYGGVQRAIRNFIYTISRAGRALGSKQEHTLTNILLDLYQDLGFQADDPSTWRVDLDYRNRPNGPKRYPTVTTLRWFIEKKLAQVFLGTNSETINALDDVSKMIRQIERGIDAEARGKEVKKLDQLKQECVDVFAEFVNSMSTGREVEGLFRYGSKEVLQSCYERVSNLERTGLFRRDAPSFDPCATIWRYDLSALTSDAQKMAVDFVLDDLFADARGAGMKPRTELFVVVDEAHKFIRDDPDHCISVWAREARKFGLGLILSSQNLTDFPDQVLAQMGTKFVLGVDNVFLDGTARKLKVETKRLGGIETHKSSLISIKNKGDGGTRWLDMRLP